MIRSRRCKCRDHIDQRAHQRGERAAGRVAADRSPRWRRRNLTFDKISFFLASWSSRSPLHRLRGLPVRPGSLLLVDRLDGLHARDELHRAVQLREAVTDSTFLQAVSNNILMAIVVPS